MANLRRLLPRIEVDDVLVINALKTRETVIARELLMAADSTIELSNVDFAETVRSAIQMSDLPFLRFITSRGNTINFVHFDGSGPLQYMSEMTWGAPMPAMLDFLLEYGAHDLRHMATSSFVSNIVESYKAKLTETFGNSEVATLNDILSSGHTLLHMAVLQGTIEDVRSLYDRGAVPSVKTSYGTTALDLARKYKCNDMIEYLKIVIIYEDLEKSRRDYVPSPYGVQSSTILNIPPELFARIKEFSL